MKIWQLIAIPVCIGVWLFIAAANLDAMSSLAGDGILFDQHGVTITARHAYAVVSLSADAILAITAVAVFWQAERRHRMRAALAVVAWAICAAVSWHSMWIWLGKNQHGNIVESTQSMDVYEATKVQFDDAQKHYSWMTQTKTSKMGPKTLAAHTAAVKAAEDRLDELRKQLATTDIKVAAKPIPYFDVLGATLLLILNTICWPAIFGPRHPNVRGVTPPVTATVTAPVSGVTPLAVTAVTALPVTPVTPGAEASVTPDSVTPRHTPENAGVTPVTAAVTPPPPPAVTPTVTPLVTATVTPPDDDPKPPASQIRRDNPSVSQVIMLQEGAERAVKLWRKRHTSNDNDGFLAVQEAWDSYQQNGTVEISKDEFGRLLKAELDIERKSKRIGGKPTWGYPGVALAAETKRATATT